MPFSNDWCMNSHYIYENGFLGNIEYTVSHDFPGIFFDIFRAFPS